MPVKFTQEEINEARRLKTLGLAWTPQPGHYVFDEQKRIEAPSPFQEGVYYILDLKHFLRRVDTIEQLVECMTWLPEWRDARRIAAELGVSDNEAAERLSAERAIETGTELLRLYRLIGERLSPQSS